MEILKRMISALLVLVMVFTMLPVSALAEETTVATETVGTVVPDGPLAGEAEAVATVPEVFVEETAEPVNAEDAPTSGTCGENLTWELVDGMLTISGLGDMYDYGYDWSERPPWGGLYEAGWIISVSIGNGVTSIGEYAFCDCFAMTSITIPDSVTSIGYGAFQYCSSLTSINIPNSVTSIGDSAFYGCRSLISIVLSDSLTSIGKWVFVECSSLTNIIFPEGVASIGIRAFDSCSSLTSITIPASVTSIGYGAFQYCSSLTSINIPNSVTSIGDFAFYGCDSLININADENNMSFASVDGVLYTKAITTLVQYPIANSASEYIIPDSVTTIGSCAFAGCESLTSITIPGSVTSISAGAFQYCSILTSITIPDSVTSIGTGAFRGCSNLTSITIPDSVIAIGSNTFAGCESLTSITIPDSVTAISYGAFYYCSSLTDVYYDGSEKQWANITIDAYNKCLTNANIHYNSTGPGTDDMSTELTGWQRAYYEFITENNTAWIIPPTYELLYVNDDSIPELYYYCGYGWGALLTYDTEFHRIDVVHGSLTYNERSGVFISSCARQGYHMDSVYRLENGEAVSLAYGEYEMNTNSPDYYWEGETITEEQYNQKKAEYVSPETALKTASDSSVIFDYDGILEWLKNYKIEEEETEADNSLIVFSDYSNLSICTNAIITLGVGIQKNGEVQSDLSGITFQIADNTVLDVVITDYEDNFYYVKLRGLKAGNTTVTFSDSGTGETVAVPVSVSNRKVHSYALNDIPVKEMDGFPANFYNINGLYIDSYKYSVNDDQSANVSFDVYNSNYSYGVVEIYKENGDIHGVVLIDKAISSTTGFKEVLWDGVRYCIRDFANKTAFTYRQESGFSKKTPINIEMPKNGYIKICSDPAESLICGVVNAVDILMQLKSIKDELKDYGEHCFVFYKELTSKMLADETYALLLKDGNKAAEKFWKNVGKEIFISSDFMENTAMSIAKNIEELDLGNLIAETASDFGWDIGTDVFVHLAGPAGDAIKLVFAMGKTIDLLIEFTDLTQAIGGIKIYIQNQGGGILSAQQIKVESQTDFPDKTALNVFKVTLDSLVLDALKKASPELYEAVTNGKTYTYNISLLRSGKEFQPDSPVTVYIPIPEDLKLLALAKKAKVYRTEEDGSMTEMSTKIQDGCFVFTTDHFSLYTIVGSDSFESDIHEFSLGDVNHDNRINAKDATLILQKVVGVLKDSATFCEACADVSGDGKLNAKDSTLILQVVVGLRDSFPAEQ